VPASTELRHPPCVVAVRTRRLLWRVGLAVGLRVIRLRVRGVRLLVITVRRSAWLSP